ncbi:MAG: T9SS type A sorting domain-containing protein, partial [candidate division WOR-3 bacterium]
SPALGDVDGDGIKDIAIPYDNGIRVYRYDGTLVPGFPAPCGAGYSSCIVVDIDGDGKGEVFKGSVNGTIEGYKYGGEKVPGFPIDVYSYAYPTPQVVDLNGDGKYELVASSFANLVFVYNTEWNIGQSPWLMYKHDRFRTGWAEYTESQGTDGVSLTKESSDSREELMAGEITIFDVSGRVVFKGDAVEGLKILKGLRYGVYFVKQKGNQKLVKRVVVR